MALKPRRNTALNSGAPRIPEPLAYARTCYSHLAGRLAVEIAEALERREFLVRGDANSFSVTERDRDGFESSAFRSRNQIRKSRFVRPCLDWSERRHHIAGQLGSALLDRFRQLKWIAPLRDSRAVRVTLEGQRGFRELCDVRK